ncbi:signal peptidase I [Hamadaea flava]|uniref:Signal peptidase I n=1 Tax=Hamadaea flava TaxID=1742688 RepID=A0ABV8LI90_9ACTN|nr:signal peptidase I [Hamadaea flava]MCP2324297.1 signal peptidase I [Hamadaea flava]
MTEAGLISAAVLSAFGVVLILARLRVKVITVKGQSMAPSYQHGDRLLMRRTRVCRRDDVVVFTSPIEIPMGPALLVKRVAAVPGDPVPEAARTRIGDAVVPPGQLVVLGDNQRSLDSRELGYIALDSVVGVVQRRLAGSTP